MFTEKTYPILDHMLMCCKMHAITINQELCQTPKCMASYSLTFLHINILHYFKYILNQTMNAPSYWSIYFLNLIGHKYNMNI